MTKNINLGGGYAYDDRQIRVEISFKPLKLASSNPNPKSNPNAGGTLSRSWLPMDTQIYL